MINTTSRLLSYDDILNQEIEVARTTQNRLRGASKNVPKLINTLFHLIYFFGSKLDKESTEGHYHQYCWYAYYHLPYTARACFLLWTRGYYLEASQLLRNILETLVKMKYLKNHTDQIEAIWLNKKFGKNRITIKTMFEEVIPGYYDIEYGQLLSGFAHGSSASLLFKLELIAPSNARVDQGVVYKENYSTYVLNQLIVYILGCLNFFPVAFPDGFSTLTEPVKKEWQSSVDWCLECVDNHKKEHPKSTNWYRKLESLYSKKVL